jgi:hypothetical protein
MGITIRKPKVPEGGSCVVKCSFDDEDGVAVTPKSIDWTLSDKNGEVINLLDAVPFTSPATSIDVLLEGADLQVLTDERHLPEVARKFLIHYVYDSSIGSDVDQNEQLTFWVENLAHPE